ncbi:MAG TPA: pyridoxal phosphate-dependent aminotransferase [Polyangia bacterium]|nr:pyridoxal phosphate-dependent aminotransferase [Polyangia bacterium]
MFSTRLPWERPENPLARAERARRAAGLPLHDLTESNPTRVAIAYPEAGLRDALAAAAARPYQPEPLGLRSAREAVAVDYQQTYGVTLDAGRLVLTASSSESYALLFKVLCDPGDAILVPEPSYPLFEYLAALEGVRPVGYRLAYDGGWHIDFDSLAAARARAAAAGARVAALVIVNPNNPTGSFVTEADLARLGDIAGAADLAVISDEVFAPYRFAGAAGAVSLAAVSPALCRRALVFSLGGLSKACGLPQLKVGWIAAGGPAAAVQGALARLELVADTYLSVAGPVQHALPLLLPLGAQIREQIQDRVRSNRVALRAAVYADSPCSLLEAAGGWTAILRVPDLQAGDGRPGDERWALTLLAEDGVLVHPGHLFDMPPGAYLVASLLPPPGGFVPAATALIARCSQSVP